MLGPGRVDGVGANTGVEAQGRAAQRESLAAPGAFAGTAAARCDVPAPAITGAKLLINGLENVTFTGRQL